MPTPTPPPAPDHGATELPEDPFAQLIAVLSLERLGEATMSVTSGVDDTTSDAESRRDVFLGQSQRVPHGRVFGGQVLAQSIMAAGATVADEPGAAPRPIHSLHAYFVRPGDDKKPIRFSVQRVRDGGSFSVRRVHAIQDDDTIFVMYASFQEVADGLDHHEAMPEVPGPEDLPTVADQIGHLEHPVAQYAAYRRAIDMRHVEGGIWLNARPDQAPNQHVWMRAKGELPDDPLMHAAVLAYASDYALLEPVIRGHGLAWGDPRLRVASLDHVMWFHRPARADDWILYTQNSPSAQGGRGLGVGRMFSRDGTLLASVAQEGMVRLKDG
ncbi:acyl-CoA thioesterase [Arsenicicoccus piscis]|uniref:Acyl-CoA thioesterase II n=1 Tax=Arsenicicoccus piscis TaxID=673954 RepID=A0ABQ6HMD7_9MICO|nr:acyl-CoA thioesterase II [Arsenicicoccus piscis]GMA18664.1 acyl-CoA thioesterase II [Arsenicicoccus piscis]